MINPLKPTGREQVTFEPDDVVFLCEGMDECAVIAELTQSWLKKPKIGTRDDRGQRYNWKEEFQALAKQIPMRRIRAIGFVFDAEGSRTKRVEELMDWYRSAELALPARECELCKTSFGTTDVSTAYLIDPPEMEEGCLEDLFVPQVQSSAIWPCLQRLIECYNEIGPSNRRQTRQWQSKLVLRTFLAHRNPSNTGLNLAIRDGHLNCGGSEFQRLRDFVALFA